MLIVLSKPLRYTLGPGSQFYDLKLKALNGDKIRVTHITTDDSGTKANFVIFGKLHTNGGEDKGKMAAVYVDFSNLWSNNCTADDFEAWDPPTVIPGQCAMGKRVGTLHIV